MPVQPSCFAKSWDPNHVECKGGLDPAYNNPVTGTKMREKCSWFNSCSQAMHKTAPVAPPSPQLVPPTALLQRAVAATTPIKMPPMPPAHVPPRPPTYTGSATQYSLPTVHAQAPHVAHAPQVQQPVAQHMVQQMHQVHQMPVYQQPVVPQQYAPPHVAQFGPAYVPMPYQLPGSQMPQYLTVPEPVNDHVPWYLQLLRELGRSMVKAFGHQLAAHVDSHSIQKHKA
jgi:hypothetical protein